jgi:hypothetical protein
MAVAEHPAGSQDANSPQGDARDSRRSPARGAGSGSLQVLYVHFVVQSGDYETTDTDSTTGVPVGPMFNRWLPDGRADGVRLPVADARNEIKVWFERRCYVQDGFLRYDAARRNEFDLSVMRSQGRINAGYLFGEAAFVPVSEPELKSLDTDQRNGADYAAVGKRLLDFLVPSIAAFVNVLRLQYGQYWLRPILPWDSRQESLGNYCQGLQLKWKPTPSGSTWRDFRPTDLVIEGTGYVHGPLEYEKYLTERDWRSLQQGHGLAGGSSLALEVVSDAQTLRRGGHVRAALVQSVSALEIAIGQFLSARKKETPLAIDVVPRFKEIPLPEQLCLVGVLAKGIASATLDTALKAIETRNKIVHEGATPTVEEGHFVALFECVKRLVEAEHLKFPNVQIGNRRFPDDGS